MRAFLIVLALLVAGGVALGFYRDWFHLTVNTDKMKEDTAGAREKVRGLGKQAEDKAEEPADAAGEKSGPKGSGSHTAAGRVQRVEAGDNCFLLTTTDDRDLTLYTGPSSKLRLNDRDVKWEHLRVKDEVEVTYDRKGGKNLATSVTVHRD